MSRIEEFKEVHQKFIKALKYIIVNEIKLKQDKTRWEKIKFNFYNKFEKVLDEKWQTLSKEEKKRLAPIYLHQKAQSDSTIQKIIKTFDAEIRSVEENESSSN